MRWESISTLKGPSQFWRSSIIQLLLQRSISTNKGLKSISSCISKRSTRERVVLHKTLPKTTLIATISQRRREITKAKIGCLMRNWNVMTRITNVSSVGNKDIYIGLAPKSMHHNAPPRDWMVEAPKEDSHCMGSPLFPMLGDKVREDDALTLFDLGSTHNFISHELGVQDMRWERSSNWMEPSRAKMFQSLPWLES